MANNSGQSVLSRPLRELISPNTRATGSEQVAQTRSGLPKRNNYLQYERVLVELNQKLPSNVTFRTQCTDDGYDLFLTSKYTNSTYRLRILINEGIVLNETQQVVCKLPDLVNYVLNEVQKAGF